MGSFVGKLFLRLIMPIIVVCVIIGLFILLIKSFVKGNKFEKHLYKTDKVISKSIMRSAETEALAS